MSFLAQFNEDDMVALTRSLHRSMLSSGFPGIQGMSDEDALGFVRYFIERHPDLVTERVLFATSYTDEILAQARNFAEEEKYEFASMFYSTWIEHTLNSLVANEMRFQGRDDADVKAVIRQNSLKKKMTAVWVSVFGTSFSLSADLVERILGLADIRNDFAHYKWPATRAQDDIELHVAARDAIGPAEAVIQELSLLVDAYVRRHGEPVRPTDSDGEPVD